MKPSQIIRSIERIALSWCGIVLLAGWSFAQGPPEKESNESGRMDQFMDAREAPGQMRHPRRGDEHRWRMRRGDRGGGRQQEFAFDAFERPNPFKAWVRMDRRLSENRNQFKRIEIKRQDLLIELDREKARYRPGEMNPASVMARQSVDRLLGELHELVGQSNEITEESAHQMVMAIHLREYWQPMLRDRIDRQSAPSEKESELTRERMALWLKGAERLEEKDHEGFVRSILGEALGPLVWSMAGEWIEPPGESAMTDGQQDDIKPPPGIGNRLRDRLRRIERRQNELSEMLEENQREIRHLRWLIERIGRKGRSAMPPREGPPPAAE